MTIDFHAHILPGADHGSRTIDTSLFQLTAAKSVGVSTIVATPHFYPDHHTVDDFLTRRARSMQKLMAAYDGDISVIPAAEVLLCEGLVHLPQLPQLCISGTNVLLIEMPFFSWTRRHIESLHALHTQYTIVLAHVDRYPPDQIQALLAADFLGQLNADSLCRLRGRKQLRQWVSQGNIVALGSDIHGKTNAYRKFRRACTLLGHETDKLMSHTEQLLHSFSPEAVLISSEQTTRHDSKNLLDLLK
ncbi:MAG: CpsB/CapC family capsule biosynthesis tyrosine phosphatase [Evtepia sp.]